MRKVVCGVCGLVNLESFPTYPLCAGCSVRLPKRKQRPIHDFFQRPIKTLVWAFSVGAAVATLALLSTGIARDTRLRERGPLVVTLSPAPDMQHNGGNLLLLLHVGTSVPGDRETIGNLRLRLSQKAAREANVRVVSPPCSAEDLGQGHYFIWKEFAPDQTIKILLNLHQRLDLEMVANGFNRYQLKIEPVKSGELPLGLRRNRTH